MALLGEEKIKEIIKLAKTNFRYDKKWEKFFKSTFPEYDADMQLYTFAIFTKYNKKLFYNFLQRNDVYKSIFAATGSALVELDNFQNNNIVKANMEALLYLGDIDSKNILYLLKMLQANKDKINYGDMIVFLVKNVLYKLDEKDEQLKNAREAGYIELINSIVIDYLDKGDLKDANVLDNITLFIEASNSKEFQQLKNYISKRGNKQEIFDYMEYFNENKLVEDEKLNSFIQALINFKFSGEYFPIEWQRYLYKNYEQNPIISKLVTSDIINLYIKSKGIDDACFFHDIYLNTGGLAGTKFYAVKNNDIARDLFHEATHIIQKNNLNNKNYIGDNYTHLKDFIIQHNLSYSDYNLNHSYFSFEIEADYMGSMLTYEYLYPISDENKQLKLQEEKETTTIKNEERRASSNFLRISGEVVNKVHFFDNLVLQQPDLLEKYPILQIEYNMDGTHKSNDDVLFALENLEKTNFPKEQLDSIRNCIFGTSPTYSNHK